MTVAIGDGPVLAAGLAGVAMEQVIGLEWGYDYREQ